MLDDHQTMRPSGGGQDDFEEGQADEEEEEVLMLGGEGFTPEQLHEAETQQMAALVRAVLPA